MGNLLLIQNLFLLLGVWHCMAISVIPAFIRSCALIARLYLYLLRLLLHPVQVPYVIVDPFIKPFDFACHINGYERIVFVRAVDHDVYMTESYFAAADDVVLKGGVLDELRVHFGRVFDFIEIVPVFRFAQNIDRTVIVVIGKGCFADNGRACLKMLVSGICVPGRYTVISS